MENRAIVIIDYGAGNLRSVANAIAKLGYQPRVVNSPKDVLAARTIILPGVGAAADTMAALKKLKLIEPIKQVIAENRPFFGVCLGLQILFDGTEEGGWHECLGIFRGRVRKLPAGLKIPHMGWNQVKQVNAHPIFTDIPDNTNFYFVHSYYAHPLDRSVVAGVTEYGIEFCSMIIKDNLFATQFHPEKSGEPGLKMYSNFLKIACS